MKDWGPQKPCVDESSEHADRGENDHKYSMGPTSVPGGRRSLALLLRWLLSSKTTCHIKPAYTVAAATTTACTAARGERRATSCAAEAASAYLERLADGVVHADGGRRRGVLVLGVDGGVGGHAALLDGGARVPVAVLADGPRLPAGGLRQRQRRQPGLAALQAGRLQQGERSGESAQKLHGLRATLRRTLPHAP